MPRGCFGEGLQALIGYLGGRFGVSQRDIAEMLQSIFQVEISLGSIPAQERCVSQALEAVVQEAQEHVQLQAAVNLDETSWPEVDPQLLAVGVQHSVRDRLSGVSKPAGRQVPQQLLGEDFNGIVGSDRYSAYNGLDPAKRQACWAHLKRDFQALVERGGQSKTIGRLLLAQVKQFFGLWHGVRDGTLSRLDFQAAMQPIRHEIHCLLNIGMFVKHHQTRKTCQNILKVERALWTFVDHVGIEPTNNAAERSLRRGVIWRRRSFGTQSEAGSCFVERILTVDDYLAPAETGMCWTT